MARLNALTRSYNLLAPELARKPYFSLDRELRACFADVAPQLPGAIRDRAAAPPKRLSPAAARAPPCWAASPAMAPSRACTTRRPRTYGFREMWRDLWKKPPA